MEIVHQNSVQSGGIMGYYRSQWPASGGNGKWREVGYGEIRRSGPIFSDPCDGHFVGIFAGSLRGRVHTILLVVVFVSAK